MKDFIFSKFVRLFVSENVKTKKMFKRKWSLVEKIILIGVVGFAVFIVFFVAFMKRSNKDFYLSEGFSGWVTIRYGVPGAPQLVEKDGVLQIKIPADGNLLTATPFVDGWSRDRFFRYDSTGKTTEIPRHLEENNETKKWIHWYESHMHSHKGLIPSLKIGADTTLYDETRILKKSNDSLGVQYIEGKKTVEAFFVSTKPENLQFNPPENPDTNILVPRLKKMLTENKK